MDLLRVVVGLHMEVLQLAYHTVDHRLAQQRVVQVQVGSDSVWHSSQVQPPLRDRDLHILRGH